MHSRILSFGLLKKVILVTAGFAAVLLTPARVGAQAPAAKPGTPSKAQPGAAQVWRTPWGDPDLQGAWTNATTTPLQRPAKYMGREFLTPEERAAQDKVTAIATDKRDKPGTPEDVEGAYN